MTQRARSAAPKQAADGRWGFVVDLPPGPDGQRRQARRSGFRKKQEAQEALDTLRSEVREGTYVAQANVTVQQFLVDEWLPAVKGSLEPSTWASYDRALRLRVIPKLGGLKLRDVSPSHLNRLYAELLADGRNDGQEGGLSPRSVRYTHVIFGRAMRDAVKWQRLKVSPVTAAEPPRAKDARPPEMKTWTSDEVRQFLAAEKATRYWIGWCLLATTGMRRGEALGVRWADIDLDAQPARLAIRQTLTVDQGELRLVNRTKTGRARVIHLDAGTVAALRSARKAQLEERILFGAGYADNDLVLARPDGRPYHPERFSQEFKRRVARHGLQRIRLHDLRHTWATLALVQGQSPKVVAEQLGHSSITITLDTYSHVTPAMKSDAVELVAGLIFGGA